MARHLNFPKLKRIELKNFSLYTKEPFISLELNNGVFCLAGANGLGKSTFLAAIQYGLTGIIPDPKKDFAHINSIPKFYKESKKFSEEFFEGRVIEEDREPAEVSLEFSIGRKLYKITRGIFDSDELREFEYSSSENVLFEKIKGTPSDLYKEYNRSVTKDIGLEEFDQFVFLQYYLFTFDESRQLLFWSQPVLERILYLAFGIDPKEAKKADGLRKDVARYGSLGRNASYHASKIRTQIAEFKAIINKDARVENHEEIFEQHQVLDEKLREELSRFEKIENSIKEQELIFSSLSLKLSSLKYEYSSLFGQHFERHIGIKNSPIVRESIRKHICELCGNKDEDVSISIEKNVDSKICPLCTKVLKRAEEKNEEVLIGLKKFDKDITLIDSQIRSNTETRIRLQDELKQVKKVLDLISKEKSDFEEANNNALKEFLAGNQKYESSSILKTYQEQLEHYLRDKEQNYKTRDEKQEELKELEVTLSSQYSLAEENFVPSFTSYAKGFLGLDLDISMQTSSEGSNLILKVNNNERRQEHQLSESQRYFIDIALRMSLAEYIGGNPTIYIDTPEGSLDIAYESRAGNMFATFAQKGSSIVMTANINTSQLLLSLASQCGEANMKLSRMTSWTLLSDVQTQEEEKIESAFSAIEKALKHQ